MANQSKFEAMLEKLIAEDKAGAEELFHEIVVEKSRSIYEGLIEDDLKTKKLTKKKQKLTTKQLTKHQKKMQTTKLKKKLMQKTKTKLKKKQKKKMKTK